MSLLRRLFSRSAPGFSEASPRDAAAMAVVHAASFQRGWAEDEIYRLLLDASAVAHRVTLGQALIGFVLSRMAAGEAEILSLAVAPAWRGRKLARTLLDLHLRRLAGLGAHAVFLEVDATNTPACRLYRRAGFQEVGKRPAYYHGGGKALVLRRDLG